MPLNKKSNSNLDYYSNEQPLCPHCDTIFNIQDHEAWELYGDEGTYELTCGSCNKKFLVQTECIFRFSTDDQDELELQSEGGE